MLVYQLSFYKIPIFIKKTGITMSTIVRSLLVGLVCGTVAYLIISSRDKQKTGGPYTIDYTLQLESWDTAIMKRGPVPVVEIEAILRRRAEKSGHTFRSNLRDNPTGNKALLDITVGNVEDTVLMKRLISSEGLLQIWETYTLPEAGAFIAAADSMSLVIYPPEQKEAKKNDRQENMAPEVRALLDSIAVSKADALGEKSGLRRFIDVERGQGGNAGFVNIEDTGRLGRILRTDAVVASLPPGARLCYTLYPDMLGFLQLYIIRMNSLQIAPIQNKHIGYAGVDFDPNSAKPLVTFELSTTGARIWAEMTQKNIDRVLAIVIDDHVLSAPIVESRIEGGRAVISGDFSVDEAKTIANLIQAPALPARINVVNTRVTSQKGIWNSRHILLAALAFAVASILAWFVFKALKST
jgi:SecD/SecF fusion protein